MVDTNNTTKRPGMKKPKNIIYVDAASLGGKFKIGLYDKTNKIKHTLDLGNSVKNNYDAEACAVLYGLMYIQKSNNQNRHVLMNDCESAILNPKLIELGQLLNTKLIWIPREINKADKVAKSKINKKKKAWKNLKFFMMLVLGDAMLVRSTQKLPTDAIVNHLSPITKTVFEEILAHKERFPMGLAEFAPFVATAYAKVNLSVKKGDILKVRNELCKNNLLMFENKIITLAELNEV